MKKLLLVLSFTLWIQYPEEWRAFGVYEDSYLCDFQRLFVLSHPLLKYRRHLVKCLPSGITPYSARA